MGLEAGCPLSAGGLLLRFLRLRGKFEYKPLIPDTNAICIIHVRPIRSPIGIREGATMKVSNPSSQVLVITESRLHAVGFLAFYFGFFALRYYVALDLGKIPEGAHLFDHVLDRLAAQPNS